METKRSRRNFIDTVILGWGIILLAPIVYGIARYIIPPKLREKILESMQIGKISDVPYDGAKIVKFNKTPIVLVHNKEGQIKAFSAICTHLGCLVEYRNEDKKIHCNCHGSVFDLEGKNIGGPAPRPLQPFRVELKEDNVIVFKT
jgi:cytochrome b6-f complex iron-sulfur subunit